MVSIQSTIVNNNTINNVDAGGSNIVLLQIDVSDVGVGDIVKIVVIRC